MERKRFTKEDVSVSESCEDYFDEFFILKSGSAEVPCPSGLPFVQHFQ